METFTYLLNDDRYSVPTLSFLLTPVSSLHRRSFDLHQGERLIRTEQP